MSAQISIQIFNIYSDIYYKGIYRRANRKGKGCMVEMGDKDTGFPIETLRSSHEASTLSELYNDHVKLRPTLWYEAHIRYLLDKIKYS